MSQDSCGSCLVGGVLCVASVDDISARKVSSGLDKKNLNSLFCVHWGIIMEGKD